MLFDVDVKGALSVKKKYPEAAVLIFIAPPSIEVLKERLRNRKTESEEKLQRRFARFDMELATGGTFDHVVVNDQLQRAIDEVEKIVNKFLV
jgi:guanylate kinase